MRRRARRPPRSAAPAAAANLSGRGGAGEVLTARRLEEALRELIALQAQIRADGPGLRAIARDALRIANEARGAELGTDIGTRDRELLIEIASSVKAQARAFERCDADGAAAAAYEMGMAAARLNERRALIRQGA